MIRTRLTIWNAVVLAFVLTVIGSIVYLTTQQILYGTVDKDLVRDTKRMQDRMSRDWQKLADQKPLASDSVLRRRGPSGPPTDGDRGVPTMMGDRRGGPFDNQNGDGKTKAGDDASQRDSGNKDSGRLDDMGPKFDDRDRPPPPPEGAMPDPPEGVSPEQARRMKIEWLLWRPRIITAAGKGLLFQADRPWDEDSMRVSLRGEDRFTVVTFLDERIRVLSVPIYFKGKIVGVAQAAASLATTDNLMGKEVRTLLALLPLALLLTTLAGVYLTNHALRPVRDIAKSAEKIEATNLSGRLDVNSKDEFGMLAATFNSMLARLESSFTNLEAAYESQRRFIADASHELKTPLTAIKTRVGVAKRGTPTVERYQEHLAAIGVSADSMNSIVQGLLLLARSDEKKLELRRDDVPLLAVADEAGTLVRASTRAKLVLDVSPDLDVYVDQALFLRVLTNLFDNALRHTPADGLVRMTAREEKQSVIIEVIDNGEGIPPEHVGHVFERFHRVDAARTRELGGTGLGLPIAKSIVEAHGGTITLTSVFGQGTTVRIVIPGK